MIYTSYFANIHNLDAEKCIAICHWKPGYFKGPHYKVIAPSEEMVLEYKSGKQDEEAKRKYIEKYKKILSRLNPETIAKTVDRKILLCYERPGDFCHRHLLSKWLNENGYPCKEWTNEQKEDLQTTLF